LKNRDLEDTKDLAPASAGGAAPLHLDSEQISPGTRVGSYVIRQTIASGGGGTVYAADPATGVSAPRVAIKVMLRELAASRLALSRFQREAEVVSLINHPNIARVLESGELRDGRPYIVMELVSGENLRNLLLRRGRFSAEDLLEILTPVCSALAAAHAAGVVHRDLKASNICLGNEAGNPVVKLLDFGIAKLVEPDLAEPGLTVQGTRLGTPYGMPPEQIRGEAVDGRADIYSLGVLLFQLLTGGYPFVGSSPQEIERLHIEATPPRPSRSAPVSPAVEAVVLRCLEKQPDARFPSVGDFLAALRAAVLGETSPSRSPPPDERDAVAVYVEMQSDESDVVDDDLEDDSATVMDIAEAAFREAALEQPLQTGNATLGLRLLPPDPEERRKALESALGLAKKLVRLLDGRPSAHAALAVKVCLHVGKALVQGSAPSPRIVGGAIMHVLAWTLASEIEGVHLTAEGAAAV
jgi:eukaryotic-like serine/threonine-protein kinase